MSCLARFCAAALALMVLALGAGPALAQNPIEMLFGGGQAQRRPPAAAPKKVKPAERRRAPEKKRAPEKRPAADASQSQVEAPAADEAAQHPYDPQLARLAEIMGALAFLRDLCNSGDGDDWRDKLTTLLDADAPNGPRRQKLIGSFNRGFRGFELTYRVCTPNAEAAVARYLSEADRLTADMTYRYGAP